MARVLTAAMAEALRDGSPRGLFVAIEHPDGTGYFCTGLGSREWNGQTWNGFGVLGKISPIKHTSDIAIQDIIFALSGIDADRLDGLDDDVRNLNGSVWLACFGPDDSVIPDPYQLVDSELDYQRFTVEADGTATIEIVAHSGFYTLERSVDEVWSTENQKLLYASDIGMDDISSLQHQDLQWKPS